MTALIATQCAHCGEPIEIELNSELQHRVITAGANPVVSSPMVNIQKLAAPNIIDGF